MGRPAAASAVRVGRPVRLELGGNFDHDVLLRLLFDWRLHKGQHLILKSFWMRAHAPCEAEAGAIRSELRVRFVARLLACEGEASEGGRQRLGRDGDQGFGPQVRETRGEDRGFVPARGGA